MAGEFEKTTDPESERDRRSSSDSGSGRAGEGPPHASGNAEAGCPETVKAPAERCDEPSIVLGDRDDDDDDGDGLPDIPVRGARRARGRRLRKQGGARNTLTPEQRLLILDCWKRSGLPGTDFATVVGLSHLTLYTWKRKFETEGPAGLLDKPKGPGKGSRLPELTRRTILMLKQSNPEWGCQRISDMLLRGPALPASPGAVAQVLHDAGYQLEEAPTHPHPDHPREFERAKPNQLWQTDLFTFILKRQNRRVYLVAFLDDYSRFLVSYGLYGSQSTALVLEVLRAAIASYQRPDEILTDNGTQYHTWRGKSAFTRELERLGITQIVAAPRHPMTLGKIERFWGTLWRECAERAVFIDLDDARRRIGLFIDHYNFQRPHQGIGGLVPADRYFSAAPEVLRTLKERVGANALDLARYGEPRAPFYLTGQVGGKSFSVHAEGERMILRREGGPREEVDLVPPADGEAEAKPAASIGNGASAPPPLCPSASPGSEPPPGDPPPPGASPLDRTLDELAFLFEEKKEGDAS
jgi:transposase InsO family protein